MGAERMWHFHDSRNAIAPSFAGGTCTADELVFTSP
jgi:hypothetical protein